MFGVLGSYLAFTALFEVAHLWQFVYPKFISDPTLGIHFGRARGLYAPVGAVRYVLDISSRLPGGIHRLAASNHQTALARLCRPRAVAYARALSDIHAFDMDGSRTRGGIAGHGGA